ncbi:putative groEL-like equatorial domain-containing protein [Rosa chinensis]|uniref:Putative groEL-like equatorial domain-containing protein n=1 Tax=Rosa chinensis TaxID=74649 RepID=A0A2P6S0A8_ROSCH|nr:putative groEL-like equatorial domain-containing protein [Rosa chinensis]PRQ52112.1 putative groEL-like equatorial domain-containing protein [Rosa chinensis]
MLLKSQRGKKDAIVLEQSFGAPKVTKDGVTIAKSIEFRITCSNSLSFHMKKKHISSWLLIGDTRERY